MKLVLFICLLALSVLIGGALGAFVNEEFQTITLGIVVSFFVSGGLTLLTIHGGRWING